jgi:hypothetical protein
LFVHLLTSLCALLVHDTIATFPASNGISWLQLILSMTIYEAPICSDQSYSKIMAKVFTSTNIYHWLLNRRLIFLLVHFLFLRASGQRRFQMLMKRKIPKSVFLRKWKKKKKLQTIFKCFFQDTLLTFTSTVRTQIVSRSTVALVERKCTM